MCKMTIKLDKDFTSVNAQKRTKEAIKAFQSGITAGDVLREFFQIPRGFIADENDLLLCSAEMFPADTWTSDDYRLYVRMILDGYKRMEQITFFLKYDYSSNRISVMSENVEIKRFTLSETIR